MIRFSVYQDNKTILRFVVSGHAAYGKHGEDIVCAGVSSLVYNAVNSCEQLLGITLAAVDRGEQLDCTVPDKHRSSADVQLLLRSLVFGVEQIASLYPDNVRIQYKQGRSDSSVTT